MLYLVRSKKGHLTLHQRRPGKIRNRHWCYDKVVSEYPIFPKGQIFRIDEIPGSERIIYTEDNSTMMPAELYIVDDVHATNELWVTRGADRRLMLHYNMKPTRMRDSKEWKHFRDEIVTVRKQVGEWPDGRPIYKNTYYNTGRQVRWIRKNGKKWTSWGGHCYIDEFPGSRNIHFNDSEPTRVEVRIKE